MNQKVKNICPVCPICGEGRLHEIIDINVVEHEHEDIKGEIELTYSSCDSCSSIQAVPAQMQANKEAMLSFKNITINLTNEEYNKFVQSCNEENKKPSKKIIYVAKELDENGFN